MRIFRNLVTNSILVITTTIGFTSTEATAQTLKAGSPTLNSVNVVGSNIVLSWTQENAIPDGGYDIHVDGKDTNRSNRTTATSASIGNLDLTQSHCFKIESRYTKTRGFYTSNQLCSEALLDSQAQAGAPTLVSVDVVGSDIVLSWTQEYAIPEGGYDIHVDGKDTNRSNRTTATTASIGDLDLTQSHCFKIESRYTKTSDFYTSNQLCSEVSGTNQAPSIGGNPATQVSEGNAYSFTPSVSDPDDDELSFSVSNKPEWATFDTTSGTLAGSPASSDVGLYSNIVISVSDGTNTASLPAFSINVEVLQSGGFVSFSNSSASVTEGDIINVTITRSNGADEASVACGTRSVTAVSSTVGGDDYAGFSPTVVNFAKGETSKVISIKTLDNTEAESTETFELFLESPSTGYQLDTNDILTVTIVDDDEQTYGSTTLSWTPPSTREDGTSLSLSEIAGYRIYTGDSEGSLSPVVDINDYSMTEYTLTDIPTGTHYYGVTTYDMDGNESGFSNIIQKQIQ
jgi:hypothetical protein